MTQLAHQPLQHLKDRLVKLVAEGKAEHLAELLRGRGLPALGGDSAPADLLLQALDLHPYDPELARAVTTLTGQALAQQAALVTESAEQEDVWDYDAQTLVYNSFLLACDLPADETLFEAVKSWHRLLVERGLEASDYPQLSNLVRHALIHQQMDDSLESYWLALIDQVGSLAQEQREQGELTSEDRTTLLEAWRGLLWIPPDERQRKEGAVISFDRINRGLVRLQSALSQRVELEEVVSFLTRALRILQQTYPRSASFWVEGWKPFIATWGEPLLQAARELWSTNKIRVEHVAPAVREQALSPETGQPSMEDWKRAAGRPVQAAKVFRALSDATRQEILHMLRSHQCTVREIAGRTNLSEPTLIRHLSVLKEADLVIDQRQGREITYQLIGDLLSFSIWQLLGQTRKIRRSDESEEVARGA